MVNSSPEYLITKPGIHHLRKREKPLKTYGRRTSSTPEARGEPPSKKPRLTSVESQQEIICHDHGEPATPTVSIEREPTRETPAPVKKDEANAKKGSILNYFKPALPKRQDTSCQQTESLSSEPTPPPSPAAEVHTKKRPRLLKIRAVPSPLDNHTDASDDEGEAGEIRSKHCEESTEDDGSEGTERDPSPNGDDMRSRRHAGRGKAAKRNALTKPKSSPGIQTTLNISTQAAFSECKVCDTVWNPLYPDDVKYHTKRHKAVLRAQKRSLDDDL